MKKLVNQKTINENIQYFTEKDNEYTCLLGGIGTGSITLTSRGNIIDWEIFNKPNKDGTYPFTFFSMFSKFEGQEKGEVRILESRLTPPYNHLRPNGYPSNELAGIPRFESSRVHNEGGFYNLELFDKSLPLKVEMEAFSPFIPTNADESGIPAISFKFKVKNLSKKKCEISVCHSQSNLTSIDSITMFNDIILKKELINEEIKNENYKGILFKSLEDKNSRNFGTMCILTNAKNSSTKKEWLGGAWFDAQQDFFNDFMDDGLLEETTINLEDKGPLSNFATLKVGSIAIKEVLQPGEEKEFEFVLAWSFPNRVKSWEGHICPARNPGDEIIKNYYSYRFDTADKAGFYLLDNLSRLYDSSKAFVEALFSTDLDKYVVRSINNTLTVLKSQTCFRVGEEGRFLSWEGTFNKQGSCEGNCTHVWNYAQALCFLFPELEKSMIDTAYFKETDDKGNMAFRTMTVLGDKRWDMIPATDGQMGMIIRLYRYWKYTGDDKFLEKCYPIMKKTLDFAFDYWDENKDFVLDSRQHNTYDIEFFGENSMLNSIFFAALKAASKMAEFVGDKESNIKYCDAFEKGSALADKRLYKNGYYIQGIEDVNSHKYQFGDGVLSDQLFGQTLAHISSLGYVLPENHVKSAIKKIYHNNFKENFFKHFSAQRTYALNDDKGLVLCTWPKGTTRPRFPFVYSDEVWSGVEYQVATNLIYEGFIKEGLKIIKAIRERHDGLKRSPNDEIECGHHYVRSLASFGTLVALSGFKFDAGKYALKDSKTPYSTFVITNKGFGIAKISKGNIKIEELFGSIKEEDFSLR